MKFESVTIADCGRATGMAVVIDVLRAFTTAGFAFGQGASDILLASTVEEAKSLKSRFAGSLIMGEVNTLATPEFDFSNSSAEIAAQDLTGKRIIHRTSNGTQGVHQSVNARWLAAASFPNARATAALIRRLNPDLVTFVITGVTPDREGDEDQACADYIAELAKGNDPDPTPYLQRVYASAVGKWFLDEAKPEYPVIDLEMAVEANRFDFAMPIARTDDLLVMTAER